MTRLEATDSGDHEEVGRGGSLANLPRTHSKMELKITMLVLVELKLTFGPVGQWFKKMERGKSATVQRIISWNVDNGSSARIKKR